MTATAEKQNPQMSFEFEEGRAEKLAEVSCALKLVKKGLVWNMTKALPQAAKQAAQNTAGVKASKRVKGGSVNLFDPDERWASSLKSAVTDVVNYFNSMSLDYPENQVRLFRRSEFKEFNEEFQRRVARAVAAAREMDNHRREWLEKCREDLGDQFNSEDYPVSIENEIVLEIEPVNTEPPKWMERLDPAEFKQQLTRQREKMVDMYNTVQDAFLSNAIKFVESIKNGTEFVPRNATDASGGKQKRTQAGGRVFRKSTVENLIEFFDQIERFGVEFDCPEPVRKVMEELKEVIQDRSGNLPTVRNLDRNLRSDGEFRSEVHDMFAAAYEKLESYREKAGRRQTRAVRRKRRVSEEAIQEAMKS